MSHPEPPVNIGYQGQSGKHMLILSFTAFDAIAEVATSPVFAAREIGNMWPSHSLPLDGCLPADRPPLHVTNKGSPMVITAELVAQLRPHPNRQSRIFF
jgi:hypothetical protein